MVPDLLLQSACAETTVQWSSSNFLPASKPNQHLTIGASFALDFSDITQVFNLISLNTRKRTFSVPLKFLFLSVPQHLMVFNDFVAQQTNLWTHTVTGELNKGDGVAEWSRVLVRLVARFRMILKSWVRVLAMQWTVEPSHLSCMGTLVALYKCLKGLFVAL